MPYFERMCAQLDEGPAPFQCKLECDGDLYAGRKALEAVRTGAVRMAWINTSHLEVLAQELSVIHLPFGPGDAELREPDRASALARLIDSRTRAAGIRTLGLMRGADQLFASPRHDIRAIEDLRGLRVRVAGPGMYEEILRSLEAIPVPLPIPAIRDAFAAGGIDCVFTSPGGWQTQFGPEVCHGSRVPGLMFITYALVADAAWFEGLDASVARTLQAAADRQVTWAWADMERDDAAVLHGLTARGASVRTVTDIDAWRRRTSVLREAANARHPAMARALRSLTEGATA